MSLIDEIKLRLEKYPQAQYECNANTISVWPLNEQGFTVTLTANRDGDYTVFFDGWHENFTDTEEAINVFALGLSTDCRLREHRRGSFVYKWTMECKEDEDWVEYSTTGLFIFPFWKKVEVRVLQNRLINAL